MHRYFLRGAAGLAMSALLVGSMAGVGSAMTPPTAPPTVTSTLNPAVVAVGGHSVDTVTVTGNGAGAPSGSVTFWACGPTATATPCTSPNLGPVTVGLSFAGDDHSTAAVTINPGSPGWFCFLDHYNGDGRYSPATDNDTATECLQVTNNQPPPTKTTPAISTVPGSRTIVVGSQDTDTATVTGTYAGGTPSGTVSFSACGPTASPAPCTSPNLGPDTVPLSFAGSGRATATDTFNLNNTGWFCLVVTYSGDGHYNSVSDNSTNECIDVIAAPPPKSAPTLTTTLSSQTIPFGGRAVDTATVTGNSVNGAPTGSVTFAACGPTAVPTPCTSPNLGPVTVGLSFGGDDHSTAAVAIDPGAPGWYCFLDRYNGDSRYTTATDNDTSTECLHVLGSGPPPPPNKAVPGLTTTLSSQSIAFGSSAVDTATVAGNTTNGTPTGSVTFTACGPTSTPTPCTSPNIGPVTVGLSFIGNNKSAAAVTIHPGAPGWYCFLDRYNGDSRYTTASDNDTTTECLDVTVTHGTKRNAGQNSPTSVLSATTVPSTGAAAPVTSPTVRVARRNH